MQTLTRNDILHSCAERLVMCRDFCGDEREEVRDMRSEHHLTPEEVQQVKDMANGTWKESQAAAGVTNPIQPHERAHIHAAVENRQPGEDD